MKTKTPIVEMAGIGKRFGNVIALESVSLRVHGGEVVCLLGDNGAGKSTLIKTLSGVHQPSSGTIKVEGRGIRFRSPHEAQNAGIATVFQDLAMVPLTSVTRNFFMGREPRGILGSVDWQSCHKVVKTEMDKIGIDVRDPSQAVGTLSGGERQCVAIARAMYFGAKVLILDEPTSALGVKQAAIVLRYILKAKKKGLGVIFITHNIHHAYAIGDVFTILKRGSSFGTYEKNDVSIEDVHRMMAGGQEMTDLTTELSTPNKINATHLAKPAPKALNPQAAF